MASLMISMESENQVRIEPYGDISENDWLEVLDWWSLGSNSDIRAKYIDVELTEFSQNKQWLRENWTRLGHQLILEEDVKKSLKNVSELMSKFLDIAERSQSDLRSFNFDEIKLNKTLTSFQKNNIASLLEMPNGANFSVPGAGKTLTTLAVWEYFRVTGQMDSMLVVCPRSAFEAWETDSKILTYSPQIYQFNDEFIENDTQILYVNYEQLENNEKLKKILGWIQSKLTMLVIDEAHRVKAGGASVRWQACRKLAEFAKRVDLLTGTPMPQSQEDLKNLFTLSWSGLPRNFFSDSRLSGLKRGGVFVRTTKKELDLPPMKIHGIELPMSRVQKEVYSAMKSSFIGQFEMSTHDSNYFSKRGKAAMTLIAAATNPGLLMRSLNEDAYLGLVWPPKELSGSERLMSVLESYVSYEIPEKYQWVSKFVAKQAKDGKKVLIWSTFIANLLALKKLLEPFNPAIIYGISTKEERKSELTKFREDKNCSVLLSNPQTLGEGVSLHQECHDAVYIDRNYNAGLYLQSLDRIHRLGLDPNQETNIFILESTGTIDQRIDRRLHDKIQRLGLYLNDSGLVEVSLPSLDDDLSFELNLGIDELDLNDIYKHLKNDD
jgi:superfamily II DNA or RNA helicase